MYDLTIKSHFDSAHFLSGYEGKCSNIHGHRWNVAITICGDNLQSSGSDRGMLVDFSKLKQSLKSATDYLDHSLILESSSTVPELLNTLKYNKFRIVELPFRVTAENLAKYFYDYMIDAGYTVKKSAVYETPDSCAEYYESRS